MKKIICIFLTITLLIVFISCNRGENPVNTTDNSAESTTNIIPATDTGPLADDKKVFDFADIEKQNKILVTENDIKMLLAQSIQYYKEYDLICGELLVQTYPNYHSIVEPGEKRIEYREFSVAANPNLKEITESALKKHTIYEIRDYIKDILVVFMMNATNYCSNEIILSECWPMDDAVFFPMHGNFISYSIPYRILLNSDTVLTEQWKIEYHDYSEVTIYDIKSVYHFGNFVPCLVISLNSFREKIYPDNDIAEYLNKCAEEK